MDVLQSLVLGAIQGLTEFIPISSTAHLILAPHILPIAAPREQIAHTYDTLIQLGTVLPVLLYFRADWQRYVAAAIRILQRRSDRDDLDARMVRYLLLGSLPAVVAGLLLNKQVEEFADPSNRLAILCIGIALIVVGALMWLAEVLGRHYRGLESLSGFDALMVGVAQAIALIPGVSRSGATITAGLTLGFDRDAAARFSFLLMTPIMIAATGYKFMKLVRNPEAAMTGGEIAGVLLATLVAAITGYGAIVFLLGWLRRRSMAIFAVYRLILGVFCVGLFFMQGEQAIQPQPLRPVRPAYSTKSTRGISRSTPASQPFSRKSRILRRPASPISRVQSLTYMPTNRSARSRSSPRANSIA